MIACARAVVLAGLRPLFVDCDNNLLLDPTLTADAFHLHPEAKVSAIMAVHVYGRQCRMSDLHAIAEAHGVKVIEDLAEAHGVEHHPRTDAACWSFYANKCIAGEEGGLVAFRNPERADLARMLRCQGFDENHDFLHIPRGHNYRLSNANARLVLASLEQADRNLEKRREVVRWYDELMPAEFQMPPRQVPWVYDVCLPAEQKHRQGEIIRTLNEQGIAARHGFKAMAHQPEFWDPGYRSLNAYRWSRNVLYLPIHPSLNREDVERNVAAFLAAI